MPCGPYVELSFKGLLKKCHNLHGDPNLTVNTYWLSV